jgi:hypothetical protein
MFVEYGYLPAKYGYFIDVDRIYEYVYLHRGNPPLLLK